ncbi:hypothetical protein BGX24_008030 [Mortierella sp. AD032]|nr:hypothetical protein BGX24_008030 [Mortierella sp. AD032]
MSTFDGLIREFPTVAIDNFRIRPNVKVYLLSHVHSDHLAGLAAKTWDSPIYCSPISATWLPMLATRSKQLAFENGEERVLCRKYAHLKPFMRPLVTDVPHYLDLGNGRRARLSLIPAHHCPGAVMFLLQDDRTCILYTGDARNEAIDLQGLRAMLAFSSSMQSIDRLYLDTTCCHPAFEKFPSRSNTLKIQDFAISDLVAFINRRPRLAHYYIDAWTFGYEDIWIGLSKAFHTKIHVSPYLYELYKAIDDIISPRILPHLTVDGSTARFHSCRLDKTCGYGGAGGEHAGSRVLIRIQPNVAWFSPLLRRERQEAAGEERILAQGTVVGRSNTYKIKEILPPSISKRDDLFYYFHYGCHASLSELQQLVELVSPRALFPCVLHRDATTHTLFRSNSEIVALLAPFIPQRSGVSTDVEEYRDREPLMTDGVTTDFQSFQHAKGFQVLDMSDKVHGITAVIDLEAPSRSGAGQYPTPIRAQDHAMLSPRSKHLRKKIDKLKRQLRNTASLESEEGEGEVQDGESSLEDGPLSMDLALIEKKRKRQSSCDQGQDTTTQETTREDFSELQGSSRSGEQNGGDLLRENNGQAGVKGEGGGGEAKPWYDQSTVEIGRAVLLGLGSYDVNEEDNEEDVEVEVEKEVQEFESALRYDRSTDRSTDISRIEPSTPEGYATSSPDSILGSLGLSESNSMPTRDLFSFKSVTTKAIGVEGEEEMGGAIKPISLSSDTLTFFSPSAPAAAPTASVASVIGLVEADESMVDPDDSVVECLYSLPPPPPAPSIPKTITTQKEAIALGESPTKPQQQQDRSTTRHHRSSSPSAAHQSRRSHRQQEVSSRISSSHVKLPSIPTDSTTNSGSSLLRVEEPPQGNIFVQTAWSPPRKRNSLLQRAQTDPQSSHGRGDRGRRRMMRSRTTATCSAGGAPSSSSHEVILIESSSSDEEEGGT